MKNQFFACAIGILSFLSFPYLSIAQNGSSLKPIPVTIAGGIFTNATITINDFVVKDNDVYVASTLNAFMSGVGQVSFPAYEKVTIVGASCDALNMFLGPEPVFISGSNFNIGAFVVTINKKNNDQQLNNTLCSIANLQNSNASPFVLVARLKQLLRALN